MLIKQKKQLLKAFFSSDVTSSIGKLLMKVKTVIMTVLKKEEIFQLVNTLSQLKN